MANKTPEAFLSGWYKYSHDKLGYKKSQKEWEDERLRGCIDLFWLAKYCLKLDLVDSYVCPIHQTFMSNGPDPCKICGKPYEPCPGLTPGISIHREICDSFVKKNPAETIFNQDTKKTRIILVSRGTFKSSIDRADCAQWIVAFPDIRIVLFSASPGLGKDMVRVIKEWFTLAHVDEDKDKHVCHTEFELFQQLYPEHLIKPNKREDGAEFTTPARRKPGMTDPTLFTLPLEGNTAGYHADVGKFDDCVSDINSGPGSTVEERAKVGANMRTKRKLIHLSGYVDYVGTPYTDDDAYAHILEKRKPEVVLVRSCWALKDTSKHKKDAELGEQDFNLLLPIDGKGAPQLTYKALRAEEREDSYLFSCHYLCSPSRSKDVTFTEQMILSHVVSPESLPQAGTYKIFSAWDLASTTGKESDYSVGCVGYFAIQGPQTGRAFIVEIERGKFNKSELAYKIAYQAAKYRVERIGIEKSPGADFLENDIMRQLVQCGFPDCSVPEWLAVDTQKDAKEARAAGLISYFDQNRLYFVNTIPIMEDVVNEFKRFKPHTRRKDDIVDAVAHLMRYLPVHIELPKNEQERQSKAEEWMKVKFKRDLIYDPDFVNALRKPEPEPPPQPITSWEGYPVVNGDGLFGT